MTSGQLTELADPPQTPRLISADLLTPSYQNRLRVIGRTLDEHSLDKAVIVDIGDAFILRAYAPAADEHIVETFSNEQLVQTMRSAMYTRGDAEPGAFLSPLKPTGYEDFLRALGHQLDRRNANAVVIVECPHYFHVSGQERIGDADNAPVAPFAEQFEFPRINNLVNEAVARRSGLREPLQPIVRFGEPDRPRRILHSGAPLP